MGVLFTHYSVQLMQLTQLEITPSEAVGPADPLKIPY